MGRIRKLFEQCYWVPKHPWFFYLKVLQKLFYGENFEYFWKFRSFFIWKFRKIFKFQNFLQIFFQNFHIFDFYLIFALSLLTINYITYMIVIKQDPLLVLGPVRPFRCIIRALPVGVLLIVVYISHFHQFHKNRSFHLLWLEGTVYM